MQHPAQGGLSCISASSFDYNAINNNASRAQGLFRYHTGLKQGSRHQYPALYKCLYTYHGLWAPVCAQLDSSQPPGIVHVISEKLQTFPSNLFLLVLQVQQLHARERHQLPLGMCFQGHPWPGPSICARPGCGGPKTGSCCWTTQSLWQRSGWQTSRPGKLRTS